MSEILITGLMNIDNSVVLIQPDRKVLNGLKLA